MSDNESSATGAEGPDLEDLEVEDAKLRESDDTEKSAEAKKGEI
jgi:hypothetical protein